jgi:stearoyl-CoA desaturase (delta-9 desaturase)
MASGISVDGQERPTVFGTLNGDQQGLWQRLVLALFVAIPTLALPAGVLVAWGWGLGWHDVVIAAVFYVVTGFGITAGFHRHFTHASFRARTGLRVALPVAGSMAIEGPVIRWVADHRKHHQFSDRDGDPHSPWRFGTAPAAVAKGLVWAHVGWLFDQAQAPQHRYAPDLLADRPVRVVSRTFPLWVAVSLLAPPLIGGLWSMSWPAAASAFFWGSLVRIGLLHHVTWSVNSICHVFGKQQFASRDRSTNVWWLALPSLGESWHNLHHAEPTSARHGVLRGQVDPSARLIRVWERLGWASDVRWPDPVRLAAKRLQQPGPVGTPA